MQAGAGLPALAEDLRTSEISHAKRGARALRGKRLELSTLADTCRDLPTVLDKVRYDQPGDKEFKKPVPSEWLNYEADVAEACAEPLDNVRQINGTVDPQAGRCRPPSCPLLLARRAYTICSSLYPSRGISVAFRLRSEDHIQSPLSSLPLSLFGFWLTGPNAAGLRFGTHGPKTR